MPSNVCLRSGLSERRGGGSLAVAGTDARGGIEAGSGARAAGGAGTDDDITFGSGAGEGMASAPHSESMSSVGGAIDGSGGRLLGSRFSVIALGSPFIA